MYALRIRAETYSVVHRRNSIPTNSVFCSGLCDIYHEESLCQGHIQFFDIMQVFELLEGNRCRCGVLHLLIMKMWHAFNARIICQRQQLRSINDNWAASMVKPKVALKCRLNNIILAKEIILRRSLFPYNMTCNVNAEWRVTIAYRDRSKKFLNCGCKSFDFSRSTVRMH
jgi:hypothetical protein